MTKEECYVLILPSIHHILKVEKAAKARKLAVELIPTPRQISSDCGMSVELHPRLLDAVLAMVEELNVPDWELYRREGADYRVVQTGRPG
jgi:hypothetical protein